MEISDIKSRLSILQVAKHYGLEPNKYDMVKCPFHEDKNPSLKLYYETNTFNCFGCSANGDVIEFIQLKETRHGGQARTKHEAILKAKTMIDINYTEVTKPVKSKEPSKELDLLSRITILMKYHQSCKLSIIKNSKAKEYCKQRNLDYKKLNIGFSSPGISVKWSNQLKENAVKLGLLLVHPKGYANRFSNCISFELLDKEGKPVSIYGRHTDENSEKKHVYLPGKHLGLYPHYPNPNTTRLILTEAIIDAATLYQLPEIAKEYEILSLYGTNGLTDEHTEAIRNLKNLKEIIFFFDGDKAGIQAVNKYEEVFKKLRPEIELSTVVTPDKEDVNSLLQGHEPELFTHLLNDRIPLLNKVEKEVLSKQFTETGSCPLETKPRLNTRNPDYITLETEELLFTLLGGINLQQLDRLRVTLKINRTDTGNPLHSIRHSLDLYHSDFLEKLINKASEQLETSTTSLRKAMAELIEQVEHYRLSKIESKKEQKPKERRLTEERKERSINYLSKPKLMERTNEDIGKTGVVGENNNRLLMYLVFTSRLREQPLHIVSLGASGTGKTYLQEKIAELIPENDKLEITILSENAFYYFGQTELKHKLVLIEDLDGAKEVLYPIRELQTKRWITKTIPIKDSKGNLKTVTLRVEGPICLAGTTTRERLYEDNANRSLLIYLDTTPEHKELIMEYQRMLSAGKINKSKEQELKEFFKDMQSVLKPIKVRNPFAEYLKIPDYIFKPLRTNAHYLAFIETVTFYHQYQREVKTDPKTGESYIETTLEDIEWTNKLLKDILLAKSDELPKAVRDFFESLKRWVKREKKDSFYTKEVQEYLRMYPMKVSRYMRELELRSFIRKAGGNKRSGFEYEIHRWDDYQKLQTGTNILDEILKQLKKNLH